MKLVAILYTPEGNKAKYTLKGQIRKIFSLGRVDMFSKIKGRQGCIKLPLPPFIKLLGREEIKLKNGRLGREIKQGCIKFPIT